MVVLSTFITDAMIAVLIVIALIDTTINFYRCNNKDDLIESVNNTTSNIGFSFAGHYTGICIFIGVTISTIMATLTFVIITVFFVDVTTVVSILITILLGTIININYFIIILFTGIVFVIFVIIILSLAQLLLSLLYLLLLLLLLV